MLVETTCSQSQDEDYGSRNKINRAIEAIAGVKTRVWGNVLVCKFMPHEGSRLLPVEYADLKLIDCIVAAYAVDYGLDQREFE